MNEQLGTNEISRVQSLRPILFDHELPETTSGVQQFLWQHRLEALTQIYLKFGLPVQIAVLAAQADLGQVDVRKIC
jgi:hypothetical protein